MHFGVDATAYDAMLRVIEQLPKQTTTMLLRFLDFPFHAHQPFVWRLLYQAMLTRPDERIITAAEKALTGAQAPRNLVEIKRIKEA